MKIHNIYIAFFCGAVLNFALFFPNFWTHLLVVFSLAPLLIIIHDLSVRQKYFYGLIYFATWLIPTTYWYYLIFPIHEAFLKSLYFTFLPLCFVLPEIIKVNKKTKIVLSVILLFIFSTIRILSPGLNDWWLPDFYYALWKNPFLIQFAYFADVIGVLFIFLFFNVVAYYTFLINKKITYSLISSITIFTICLQVVFNIIPKTPDQFGFLAIQHYFEKPVQFISESEIEILKNKTIENLKLLNRDEKIVLWPEYGILENNQKDLITFARTQKIYLAYNGLEKNGDSFFSSTNIINPVGHQVKNYKKHAAPNENINPKDIFDQFRINDFLFNADVCYDVHYLDIKKRLKNSDFLLVPIDDRRYGYLLPKFHAADIVFRAIHNRVQIISAGTTGPTGYTDKYGRIIKILPLFKNAVLTVET